MIEAKTALWSSLALLIIGDVLKEKSWTLIGTLFNGAGFLMILCWFGIMMWNVFPHNKGGDKK